MGKPPTRGTRSHHLDAAQEAALHRRDPRRAVATGLLLLVPLALPAAAEAITPSSQITTPAGIAYPFSEETSKITIAGTASEPEVAIRCYWGSEEADFETVAKKVAVVAGSFSVEVGSYAIGYRICQLRAVPVGAKAGPLPPGTPQAYEGPFVAPSRFASGSSSFAGAAASSGALLKLEEAGTYAVEGELFSPSLHGDVDALFGEASLPALPEDEEKLVARRTSVQVDGADAYVPDGTEDVTRWLKFEAAEMGEKFVAPTAAPSLTVSHEFDAATHQMTIREEDPLVKCSPHDEYPPRFEGGGGCSTFAPTGVTLVRTWQTGQEDHAAALTDTWRSTDGAAHTVSVRYYNEMSDAEGGHGAYAFPGTAFAETHAGETRTLPAGAGAILYKTSAATPEGGDGEHPQAAIAFDRAPSEAVTFTRGSSEGEYSAFEMPYSWAVPAGGSSPTLRLEFAQGFSLTEVRSIAEAALAGYYPSVSIATPANGAVVRSGSSVVTVAGSASDALGLASLTVDGRPVAVGAGGAWSTTVTLAPGANAITAFATNTAGLARSAGASVTYLPPATAAQVGSASGAKAQVSFTIACHGLAGTSCRVHGALSTVEKLRRKRIVGVAASRPRTSSKRVSVGAATVVIAAGAVVKVSIALNDAGRKLLARFHRLPVHLTATLEGEAGRSTVIAENLVVEPKPKPRRRRRR